MYEFAKISVTLEELDTIQEIGSSLDTTNFYVYFPELGRVLNEINITQTFLNKQGSKQFTFVISFSNEQNIQIRSELKNKKLKEITQGLSGKCKKTLRNLKRQIFKTLPRLKKEDKDIESIMKDFSNF
jgi:NAD+--asparagine ADP-ribosyltransferase